MPRFVVIDTETTGFVPKIHRVMEVAAAVSEQGKITQEVESLLSLPAGTDIPIAVQILTKITPKDLGGQPTFEEVQPKIEALCTKDTVIVGQNWPFDLGMLRGEGWDLSDHPWIDTSMLASLVFPEMASYSLGYLSEVLNLNHSPKHRALGDVRATEELLQKCIERLTELPGETMKKLQELAEKAPEGYRMFFASLEGRGKKAPKWITAKNDEPKSVEKLKALTLEPPKDGTVSCVEEPLSAETIGSIVKGLGPKTWFAVKNIDAVVRRWNIPKEVRVLYEPSAMIDPKKKKDFLAQESFTSDEIILAMKLMLYPAETKIDLPLHGGEYQTFGGKLACTAESEKWLAEAKKSSSGPTLMSHKELLRIAREKDDLLPKNTHVIIDDASMLEDTITQSESWYCSIPTLRAASAGNKTLSQCTDTIELWTEKTRSEQSIRYLAPSDLHSRESSELIELLEEVLREEWPELVTLALSHLQKILNADNLSTRFAWIETMRDGSKVIQSVPENVSDVLRDRLLSKVHVTLLIPHNGEENARAFLDESTPHVTDTSHWSPASNTLTFPIDTKLDQLIENHEGKAVLLVGSKRVIEDIFVRHSEAAEERGMTLTCQGFSGGQGRMQSEFLGAKGSALLVLTPWMYEGMDLKPDMLDALYLHSLPFDHPSHAIIGRRALRYQNAFGQYSLPRLKNRLFRLFRTFVSHAKKDAKILVLDDRIRTKGYGREVKEYLESLMKHPQKKPKEEGQMAML